MWGAASQLHGLSRAGVPLQQLGWGGARDWTSLSFTDYAKAFACVDHNKLWKILNSLHCRRILYQLSHKGCPRILEWVAYPFSKVLCVCVHTYTAVPFSISSYLHSNSLQNNLLIKSG